MLAVLLGLVFVIAGGYGVYIWRGELLTVLQGALPLLFCVGGMFAVVAGVTSLAESAQSKTGDEAALPTEKEKLS